MACGCDLCEMGRRVDATGDDELRALWERIFESGASHEMDAVGYKAIADRYREAMQVAIDALSQERLTSDRAVQPGGFSVAS